jgi:hypothetical protein
MRRVRAGLTSTPMKLAPADALAVPSSRIALSPPRWAARVAQQGRDVSVHAPARLAGIQRDGDGATTVQLESGEQLRCGLLIAADGALSPTRELLGLGTREWDYGHRAIVTTAAFEQRTSIHRLAALPAHRALWPCCPCPVATIACAPSSGLSTRRAPTSSWRMDDAGFCRKALWRRVRARLGAVDGLRGALRVSHCGSVTRLTTCSRVWRWSPMRRIRFIPWPVRASTWVWRTWRCWLEEILRVHLESRRCDPGQPWMYCAATSAAARATTWR